MVPELEETLPLTNKINRKSDSTTSGKSVSTWKTFLSSRPKLVEPVFLLYNFAFRGSIPVHQQFIESVVEKHMLKSKAVVLNSTIAEVNVSSDMEDEIQSEAALWLLCCNLARAVPAIFVTLMVVSYGDTGGRKLGILLSNVGGAARFLVYVLQIYLALPLTCLVLANFLEGICGTHSVITASTYSYIADVATADKRTFRFALIHALIFVAAGVSSLAMGYILAAVGYLPVFWGIVVIYIINILYIVVLLPESNVPERDQPTFRIVAVCSGIIKSFRIYTRVRPEKPRAQFQLGLLLTAGAVHSVVLLGHADVDTLYLLGSPFYFTSVLIGYFMAYQSFAIVFSDLAGVPLLQRLGLSEVGLSILSGVSGMSAGVLLAFSVNDLMIFLVPLTGMFGATATPMIPCIMSRIVHASEQGALMGSIHSMLTVSEVVSSSLLDAVYSATVSVFSGTVYLLIAGLYGIVIILLLCLRCIHKGGIYTQLE